MTNPRPVMIVLAVLLACLPAQARGAAGVLDPTFGTGGITLVPIDGEGPFTSALQPDGKVVTVGNVNLYPNRQLAVVRYTADGALDDSFGAGGISIIASGAVGDPQPHGIVLLSDGKVLIAAFVRTAPNTYTTALVRLAPDGTLDTGFGAGGVQVQGAASIQTLALQADGKILAGGNVVGGGGPFPADFAVTRYDADGVIDAGFGTGGVARADLTSFDEVNALFAEADGRITAVGQTTLGPFLSQFGIARWLADGTPDPEFGIGGTVLLPITAGGFDIAYGLAPGQGGRTVVVGRGGPSGDSDVAIAVLDAAGSADTAFAGDGSVTRNFGDFDIALSTLVEPNGRVVVAGHGTLTNTGPIPNSTNDDIRPILLRYRPDGTADLSFGSSGLVILTVPDIYNGQFQTIFRLADGRLVVAGDVNDLSGYTYFMVARYLNGICGNGTVEPGEDCDDGN